MGPCSVVMFDWGDTIMKDAPLIETPMCDWPSVEAVEGAEDVLRALSPRKTIVLVTGAVQSGEELIRQALKRVNLDTYFHRIFCFKNTGFRKPSEDFYRHVLRCLNAEPHDVVMVGDGFERDVLGANRVGISGIWLNANSTEDRSGALYRTIHGLRELPALLDGEP